MQSLYLMQAVFELTEELQREALVFTEPVRRERMEQMKNHKNRALSLTAGVLLSYALNSRKEEENIYPDETAEKKETEDFVQLVTWQDVLAQLRHRKAEGTFLLPDTIPGENGKPCFKNLAGVHFNLSHSGEYVVCMIADCEVGVDIQQYGKRPKDGVVKKVLHTKERAIYDVLGETEKEAYFYQLWSAKEAYAKYTKEGLSLDFRKLCVELYGNLLTDTRMGRTYRLQTYAGLSGYALTAVSDTDYCKERF